MEEEKVYQIELTENDAFFIIETMWEAITRGAIFPKYEYEKGIATAYNKVLNIWRQRGGVLKQIQMFAHPEGIRAWNMGKTPHQFFEEHPELLTPEPEEFLPW